MSRKFRHRIKEFKKSPTGVPSIGIGFRFGYWPCVKGPFIQFGYGRKQISFWYGLPETCINEQ